MVEFDHRLRPILAHRLRHLVGDLLERRPQRKLLDVDDSDRRRRQRPHAGENERAMIGVHSDIEADDEGSRRRSCSTSRGQSGNSSRKERPLAERRRAGDNRIWIALGYGRGRTDDRSERPSDCVRVEEARLEAVEHVLVLASERRRRHRAPLPIEVRLRDVPALIDPGFNLQPVARVALAQIL